MHKPKSGIDLHNLFAQHQDATGTAVIASIAELKGVVPPNPEPTVLVAFESYATDRYGLVQELVALISADVRGILQCNIPNFHAVNPKGSDCGYS